MRGVYMDIYIDSDYKCYTTPGENLRKFNVPFFQNKCAEFISGYRYIPKGEIWIRNDGKRFEGEMVAPFKNYTTLYIAQLKYELNDADLALERLGVVRD